MSFASLPDDVLLDVFTTLDFHSIVALRQTCRRSWVISKLPAVWLDAFRWLTTDSKDWRSSLADSVTSHSNEHFENLVTRMVHFEINWNHGQPRQIRYFKRPTGIVSMLVPGGRYFLCPTTGSKEATLVYYDFDSNTTDEITRRVLINYRHKSREIRAMDVAVDPLAAPLEFDLAIELASEGKSIHPHLERLWYGGLGRKRMMNLQQSLPAHSMCFAPISLCGDYLLRASMAPSHEPVYVVHRWRGIEEDRVSHSLLLPEATETPQEGVRLLPDGRIISIFHDRVELHVPPEESWEESPLIPKHSTRVAAQWVFKYTPSMHQYHRYVSRFVHYPAFNSVAFSVHNGESLFSFWTVADSDSLPNVTITPFGQMEEREHMGLGTSHAIRNKPGSNEAVFMRFFQSRRLLAFSGITSPIPVGESEKYHPIMETLFTTPSPSRGGAWVIDEHSGRVLCTLERREGKNAVLYF